MIDPGTELTIHYPVHTHLQIMHNSQWVPRRIEIRQLRDLVDFPLTPEEFLRRPYIARSRWLVQAYDLTRRRYRQFYLGTTKEFRSPQVLRFGAYDDTTGKLLRLIGPEFGPTILERRLMLRKIPRLIDKMEPNELLRIFAPDISICR